MLKHNLTKSKYFRNILFLLLFIALIFFIFFNAKIELKWLFEWYDIQDKDTEKLINLRIENKWSFGGIDFDGFQFAMFFTRYNPFIKGYNITNWALFTTSLNTEKINKLFSNKIKDGLVPLGISVYQNTISTFFASFDKPLFIISYKIGIYEDNENNNISNFIQNEINNNNIPVGFSYYENKYYILYLKIKNHTLKNKIWGIDWVVNNSVNIKNYLKLLYKKGLKVTDFDIKNDTIGFFWTESY